MIGGRVAWRRFRANRPATFGLGLTVAIVAFAALVPAAWPCSPNVSDFTLPPSAIGGPPAPTFDHPLGADPLYRDLLARLAAGARLSLVIALVAALLAMSLGISVGVTAALAARSRQRWLDVVLQRAIEVALAFPYLLLVTAIGVALDRAGPLAIAATLGATGWIGLARLVREKTLRLLDSDHVLAARALGVPPLEVVRRHVLPGLRGMLLVVGSQSLGQMVLAEAVLGYLTVGVGPPQASLGRMLQEAEHYLGAQPLLVGAPALAIVLTVFGLARVADGLSEALESRSRATRATFPADALVLAGLVAVVVGFARPEPLFTPTASGYPQAGVLRIASAGTPAAIDPALANDGLTLAIDELVHGRLLARAPDGTLRGGLAERYSIEDEGRRVTLTLRTTARFHEGTPVTAADVKRSLERALHPRTPSPWASLFDGLVGFAEFRAGTADGIAGISVSSEHDVVFSLSRRDATFPSLLSLGVAAPVCRDAGHHADPTAPSPCGAGPYRLAHRDEERVVLERRDGHPDGSAEQAARIEWLLGVPARTQLYRFERGELDLLTDISGIDAQRFQADPRWAPLVSWLDRPVVEGVFLNTTVPPFDNPHVRRAVSLALDASPLARLKPSLAAATRIFPPGIARPLDGPDRRHDLAAALEEMRLAGFPFDSQRAVGGYPHAIDYVTVPSSLDQAVAEVYQQELAKIGLDVRIRLLSFASYLAEIRRPGACAMGWRAWQPDFPEPAAIIDPLLTSDALSSTPTQNVSFYSNPRVDALAKVAREEPDDQRRLALYAEAEAAIARDAPWIPVYSNRGFVVRQPWIASVPATADGRVALDAVPLRGSAERGPR